jgi:hypothetical protein
MFWRRTGQAVSADLQRALAGAMIKKATRSMDVISPIRSPDTVENLMIVRLIICMVASNFWKIICNYYYKSINTA